LNPRLPAIAEFTLEQTLCVSGTRRIAAQQMTERTSANRGEMARTLDQGAGQQSLRASKTKGENFPANHAKHANEKVIGAMPPSFLTALNSARTQRRKGSPFIVIRVFRVLGGHSN
jgi:hypothetical protein